VSPDAGNTATTGARAVVEVLAQSLVGRPDAVRVTESRHKDVTLIEVYVSPQDMPRMLGRMGRTVAALRTLASSAGEREGKQVTVEIREAR
jgi:predicted RNA-binding protein YlqC (UPF0109 family)